MSGRSKSRKHHRRNQRAYGAHISYALDFTMGQAGDAEFSNGVARLGYFGPRRTTFLSRGRQESNLRMAEPKSAALPTWRRPLIFSVTSPGFFFALVLPISSRVNAKGVDSQKPQREKGGFLSPLKLDYR